jgi:F-type H+-transporting ATPase subunit gamma
LIQLRDLRRRVDSIEKTQQMTRAMKMVASARLLKTQQALMDARPYSDELDVVLRNLANRCDRDRHILLRKVTNPSKILVVIITSDRGLCGAFNSNLYKYFDNFIHQNQGKSFSLITVGKKGTDYFKYRADKYLAQDVNILQSFREVTLKKAIEITPEDEHNTFKSEDKSNVEKAGVSIDIAFKISSIIREQFEGELADQVIFIYNSFKTLAVQVVTTQMLLPIEDKQLLISSDSAEEKSNPIQEVDFIYEPNAEEIIETLLELQVNRQIWRTMLESAAAEQSARMIAMESATKNADDMIKQLTLMLNRARQTMITIELLDIIGGAEALKQSK